MATFVVAVLLLSAPLLPARAQRQMERLGRGVVAVRQADGRVWVGLSVAWQNVAYNQPPHTSFFVGEGMKRPPRPNIVEVRVKK